MRDRIGCCWVCGCTDADCSGCTERLGEPCEWVGDRSLCSACAPLLGQPLDVLPIRQHDKDILLANGMDTVGAVEVYLWTRIPPRGLTRRQVEVIRDKIRQWLTRQVTVGPMGATSEQKEYARG
jgi:hypothetical protein